jgi:hydroxymethylpyrimidine pyrophosphatase-like HAD family hydrolase
MNVYSEHRIFARCEEAHPEHRELVRRYQELTSCRYVLIDSYEQFRGTEPDKVLVLADEAALSELERTLRAALPEWLDEHAPRAHLIRGDFFLELLHPEANKALALHELCTHIGTPLSRAVGFGDGENDKEFLAAVGCGVAVANAAAVTKRAARRVSPWTNDEDAVARELEAMIEAGEFGTPKGVVPV